ncbi:MAG: carboxylating nicotinate-nucleotide diphosphorylase [Firmicutes bacterium]|nr:carboxylating nicotinate-nucleotide diphosphorylase [Bacillota bacterium]
MNPILIKEIVKQALEEDLGIGDLTSDSIFKEDFNTNAVFRAKSSGVIAGLPIAVEVFQLLDPGINFTAFVTDGVVVSSGAEIAKVTGPIKSILAGERVALNFLQHLSGIATKTAGLVKLVEEFPVKVVDTRKTTPGLRILEKYAVLQGGGHNHRFNLADAVLIKDNHIKACGSILEAVKRAREGIPHTMKIEIEVENETQVKEALAAKVDIIMLDNMTPAQMAVMVRLINGRAIVEASGNIDESSIKAVSAAGVDIISSGAITHSVNALDISLDILI